MKGIFTALITPYTKSGKIDYTALGRLLRMQAKSKVDGVVLLGSTGEEKLLTKAEKLSIIKNATNILVGKKIYVGINEITIAKAKNVIKNYENLSIDGYLASPPPYLKLSQAEIINFYTQIASFTQKDICIYNVPSRTGTSISVNSVCRLAKIPNITAIKDATGDIRYAKKLIKSVPSNFSVLCGNDNLYFKMKKLGAHGAVCVTSNLYPNLFCENILDSKKSKHQYKKIIKFVCSGPNPATIKYMLAKHNYISNILREPLLAKTE